ncbi:MAG: hypothetical protein M1826_001930 [Phylliscum demangeonii]|nr:MAG: hypothetical protein M1826_001930 [Phylliscum demangeonii]
MAPSQKTMWAPLASALPDLPAGEVLTADEWTTLLAVAEAVIPSIHRASAVAPSAHLDLGPTAISLAAERERPEWDGAHGRIIVLLPGQKRLTIMTKSTNGIIRALPPGKPGKELIDA